MSSIVYRFGSFLELYITKFQNCIFLKFAFIEHSNIFILIKMKKRFKNDCYNTYVLLMDRSFAYIFCQGQNLTLHMFRINNLKNIFFSYLTTNVDPKENICKKWSKNEN